MRKFTCQGKSPKRRSGGKHIRRPSRVECSERTRHLFYARRTRLSAGYTRPFVGARHRRRTRPRSRFRIVRNGHPARLLRSMRVERECSHYIRPGFPKKSLPKRYRRRRHRSWCMYAYRGIRARRTKNGRFISSLVGNITSLRVRDYISILFYFYTYFLFF